MQKITVGISIVLALSFTSCAANVTYNFHSGEFGLNVDTTDSDVFNKKTQSFF